MTKSKNDNDVKKWLISNESPETPLWDGFDDALIGYEPTTEKAVYDRNKMVSILVERDEMTEEESLEYIDFNIIGSYIGIRTPIHIIPL